MNPRTQIKQAKHSFLQKLNQTKLMDGIESCFLSSVEESTLYTPFAPAEVVLRNEFLVKVMERNTNWEGSYVGVICGASAHVYPTVIVRKDVPVGDYGDIIYIRVVTYLKLPR